MDTEYSHHYLDGTKSNYNKADTGGFIHSLTLRIGSKRIALNIIENAAGTPADLNHSGSDLRDSIKEILVKTELLEERSKGFFYSTSPNFVRKHVKSPELDGGFMCMYCDVSFHTADDVQSHELACGLEEASNSGHTCECGRWFDSIDELGIHMKLHELAGQPLGEENALNDFVCKICSRGFSTKLILQAHELSHTGLKPHKCPTCGLVFGRSVDLKAHERTHKSTSFECSVCGVKCLSLLKLRKHEVAVHTGTRYDRESLSCLVCSKICRSNEELLTHEQSHEQNFSCPICYKAFTRQSNFNVHMKLHASGRRVFCALCGKWFKTATQLNRHSENCVQKDNNTARLRHSCRFCEKKFVYRRDVTIHERVHTGERPYVCGYCGKGFSQSQALTIHIRIHTGERPYPCQLCNATFGDSSALRKHEVTKHLDSFESQFHPQDRQRRPWHNALSKQQPTDDAEIGSNLLDMESDSF